MYNTTIAVGWFPNRETLVRLGEDILSRFADAHISQNVIYIGIILEDADAEKFEKNLQDAITILKERYAAYEPLLGTLEVRGLKS
nr:hypothetical protein K-LCC10_0170 [Kaumoebavirus]